MAISSIQGVGLKAGQPGDMSATDLYTKNIRQQIMDTRKKIQDISSDEKMSVEEKMKKRQELQQEISDLNTQLRQYLAEKQKEQKRQQEKAAARAENTQNTGTSPEETVTGGSGTGMSAMISAGASLKQAQSHDGVKVKLEGRAGVLRAEIRQDAPRGDVEAKERELARIEKKISDVSYAQMSSLKDANQVMREAAEVELSDENNRRAERSKRGEEIWLVSNSRKSGVGISGTGQGAKDNASADSVVKKKAVSYVSVDIRG